MIPLVYVIFMFIHNLQVFLNNRKGTMPEENSCPICQEKELSKLKNELHLCKQSSKSKDNAIKKLNKRVFILTAIAVGIGAIFGKEALDTIVEWMESIGKFNSGATNMSGAIVPAPSTLAVFGMLALVTRKSRKRK
jgi:hypothetical protein